jgi:hypothetical protein
MVLASVPGLFSTSVRHKTIFFTVTGMFCLQRSIPFDACQRKASSLDLSLRLAGHNRRLYAGIDQLPHAAEVSTLPISAAAIRAAQELIVQ